MPKNIQEMLKPGLTSRQFHSRALNHKVPHPQSLSPSNLTFYPTLPGLPLRLPSFYPTGSFLSWLSFFLDFMTLCVYPFFSANFFHMQRLWPLPPPPFFLFLFLCFALYLPWAISSFFTVCYKISTGTWAHFWVLHWNNMRHLNLSFQWHLRLARPKLNLSSFLSHFLYAQPHLLLLTPMRWGNVMARTQDGKIRRYDSSPWHTGCMTLRSLSLDPISRVSGWAEWH